MVLPEWATPLVAIWGAIISTGLLVLKILTYRSRTRPKLDVELDRTRYELDITMTTASEDTTEKIGTGIVDELEIRVWNRGLLKTTIDRIGLRLDSENIFWPSRQAPLKREGEVPPRKVSPRSGSHEWSLRTTELAEWLEDHDLLDQTVRVRPVIQEGGGELIEGQEVPLDLTMFQGVEPGR